MSSRSNALVRRTSGSLGREDAAPPPGREPGWWTPSPERARALLLVAARPTICALAATVTLVLVVMLTTETELTSAPGAVGATWLAAHQIPLTVGRTTLGLLPLVPTALLVWLAARECARAVPNRPQPIDLAWLAGAVLAGPLLMTAVCLAVTGDAAGVTPLERPGPISAFGWVIVLYLGAAAAGIASRAWPALCDLLPVEIPEWAVLGARAARRTVLRMLGCAALATVISLFAHLSRFEGTYQQAHNVTDVLGMSLLSLLYLPNVVIAAAGLLCGAAVQFGTGSVGLFGVGGGQLPAVPALIPVPEGPASAWWPALLLVPLAVGVLGGIELGRTSDDRPGAPWATLTSAGLSTLAFLVLAALGSGQLGAVGWVGVDLLMLVPLMVTWFGFGGFVGMVFARRFLAPAAPVEDYDEDDYDDYYDEDDYFYDDEDDADPDDTDHDDDTYADADPAVELDAELVEDIDDEVEVSIAAPGSTTEPNAEIVDAEVVEADLPEGDTTTGR
ncbi:cell division protein PerM [Nocardia sp. SSK8]|uniref:cell division protein PerM n=1 Tax=Nocardia sp. SSK8 TaxID=3120154 RepID=UPI00300AA3B5